MMKILMAAVILLSTYASPTFAEHAGSEQQSEIRSVGHGSGGFRGKRGRRSRFRGRSRGFHFRRGDLTHYFYYRYPRYFYRNFGGIRKFYPRDDHSSYPNQGGSDYRDSFYFPQR